MQQLARTRLIRTLHEIAFSLNIVSAVAYGLLLSLWTGMLGSGESRIPDSDAVYYFLRAAVRVNDALGILTRTPVSTEGVARQSSGPWSNWGQEITVLATVLCAAMVVVLVLRLLSGTRSRDVVMNHTALVAALFTGPICYLAAAGATPSVPSWLNVLPSDPYWRHPLLRALLLEVLCLAPLLLAQRVRSVRSWLLALCLVLHYAFWIPTTWLPLPVWVFTDDGHLLSYASVLLQVVSPLAGFSWLLYVKSQQSDLPDKSVLPTRVSIGMAAVCLVTLMLMWYPGRRIRLVETGDSPIVTLSRGPCYGSCPSYSLTIDATGRVVYQGQASVRVRGRQIAFLRREQVNEVLDRLDRLNFFNIEDRAFGWGFDTPSVALSVSTESRTKRVVSDGFFVSSKVQFNLVKLADHIDEVVGSARWVRCPGPCR